MILRSTIGWRGSYCDKGCFCWTGRGVERGSRRTYVGKARVLASRGDCIDSSSLGRYLSDVAVCILLFSNASPDTDSGFHLAARRTRWLPHPQDRLRRVRRSPCLRFHPPNASPCSSRKTFTRIFPSYAQLPPFPPLSPRDLDLIHSADASTSQAYDALKTTLNVPILTLLDDVIRIVSYHAASDRFAALKKAWSLLDDVLEHVEITLRSVAVGDVSRSSARRADFVGYIFVLRMVGVNLLWGCDLLLEDLKGVGRETAVALRRSSQAKLDDALVRLASHAFVLMVRRSFYYSR